MFTLHVVTEEGRHNTPPPPLLSTYTVFFLLPKCAPLPRHYPLVHRCPLLAPNEPWGAHHCFGLAKVFLTYHPTEHLYHFCQSCLHPYGIAPHYLVVVCIEDDVVITRSPAKYMMCLLRPVDFQQDCPCHCVHNNIEDIRGDWVPLCHPSISVMNVRPKNFPAFDTIFCYSQYLFSNLCRLVPSPYPLRISMHLPLKKEL